MKIKMDLIKNSSQLSIRRQCKLLQINRNTLYYQPVQEKPENLKMMHIMDKLLLQHPPEGVMSMVFMLRHIGYPIGHKRIRCMFRIMGHETLYLRKTLTEQGLEST